MQKRTLSDTRIEAVNLKEVRRMGSWGGKKTGKKPVLPPKSEWGNPAEFETVVFTKRHGWSLRCQAFAKRLLEKGYKGLAAQCPNSATDGEECCKAHLSNRRKKTERIANIQEILNQTKRYKTSIPNDILRRFIDMADDPDRLSLEAELNLVTARAGQLLERIDTNESKRAWQAVKESELVLRESIKTQDPNGIRRGMNMLRMAINKSDYPIWHELINTIHNRRVLVESERKRMVEQAQVITMDAVMIILGKIQEIIINNVPDEKAQNSISKEFRRLIAPDVLAIPQMILKNPQESPDGCEVCRNEDFIKLQLVENSVYKCPECQRTIRRINKKEKQENAATRKQKAQPHNGSRKSKRKKVSKKVI